MKKEKKKQKNKSFFNVYVASIGSMLTDISTEIVYPLLPIFLTTVLRAPASVLGLVEGVAESTAAILKVFSGYFSDRFQKRKPLALLGYSFSTLGKLFLFVAQSWPTVLFARFIDRVGKGIRTAPRDALISESVDASARGRAFGFHRAFDTFGAFLGVLFAYLFVVNSGNNLNFRNIFLLALIPAFAGVLVLFLLKEPAHNLNLRNIPIGFKDLSAPMKYLLVVTFIFSLGNSSNQFLLLRAKNLGASVSTVLLIYLVFNLSYSLLSYPAGRLSDIIGRRRVIVPGYLLYAVVYFWFAKATRLSELWGAFLLYGVYQAFTEGVEKAVVADFSTPETRATSMGAHAMMTGAGLLPASLIAGYLWEHFSPSYAFYFGSIMALISALMLWYLLYKYDSGGFKHVS